MGGKARHARPKGEPPQRPQDGKYAKPLSRSQRLRLLFAIVVIPLAGLYSAILLSELPSAFRGSAGQGVPGQFAVHDEVCVKGLCSWVGEFTAESGYVLRDVHLMSRAPTEIGQTVKAVDAGTTGEVYPQGGNAYVVKHTILTILSTTYAVGGTVWAVTTVRRRLRNRVTRVA